jgi:hypothetical protein
VKGSKGGESVLGISSPPPCAPDSSGIHSDLIEISGGMLVGAPGRGGDRCDFGGAAEKSLADVARRGRTDLGS